MLNAVLIKSLLKSNNITNAVLKPVRCFCTESNYDKLVKNNKVVVFMKGVPSSPSCGFSNAVVQILRMHGVTYDSHNVLESEELREGNVCF